MPSSLSPSSLAVYLCAGALTCLAGRPSAQAGTATYSAVHLQAAYGDDLGYFSMAKDGTLTAGSLVGGLAVIIDGVRNYAPFSTYALPFDKQGNAYTYNGSALPLERIHISGEITNLGYVAQGQFTFLRGQNRVGTVVGEEYPLSTGTYPTGGVIYDPVHGGRIVQDMGGVNVIYLHAVNDSGYLVGYGITNNTLEGNLYLWVEGQPAVRLVATDNGIAEAINEAAQVVGYANNRAFFWENGILTNPASYRVQDPARPGVFNEAVTFAIAYDISEDGLVVGGAEMRAVPGFTPSQGNEVQAWTWTQAQGLTFLNDLIDPALGYHLESAHAIADDGSILVLGTLSNGQGADFLLRPLPEPSVWGMLLLSFGIIYRRRR